jgi:uncharacterized delta-60 repeat protein
MAVRGLLIWAGMAVSLIAAGGALADPGDLDESFSGDGWHTVDLGGDDSGEAVALQPDGRIVVAGYGWAPFIDRDLTVARLNPDGSPDGGFDTDGLFRWSLADGQSAGGVAVQPDGKLVVVGTLAGGAAAVLRLQPGGTFDMDFNAVGFRADLPGSLNAVAVQPDGKIVVGGGNGSDLMAARLLPGGAFDPAWGGGPVFVGFEPGFNDFIRALALQPDGKTVVVGTTTANAGDWTIMRLTTTGFPDDGSFPLPGEGGFTLNFGGQDQAGGVAVQPDGKIVVAGTGNGDFVVRRFNPDGSPDSTFGGGPIDFSGVDVANAVALQADGKIIVAGTADASVPGQDMAVARLLPDGRLDPSFSVDGKTRFDFGGVAWASAMALQPDGRIVVAGSRAADVGPNTPRDIAIMRLEGDPPANPIVQPPVPPSGPPRVVRCGGKRATIVGTARKDRLRGTRRADVIAALGGNDSVKGGGGNDLVCGGAGNDTLVGEAGKDRLFGEAGADRLGGGPGNDALSGGPGTDSLRGEAGRDKLTGGPGRKDVCRGGAGKDRAACERGA